MDVLFLEIVPDDILELETELETERICVHPLHRELACPSKVVPNIRKGCCREKDIGDEGGMYTVCGQYRNPHACLVFPPSQF